MKRNRVIDSEFFYGATPEILLRAAQLRKNIILHLPFIKPLPHTIKYLNALSSGFSFLAGSITHHPFISKMPPAVSIELTNFCNLKCPECPSGSGLMKRERGYIEKDLFVKILTELRPYLTNTNLYFQGEPMMHPRFFELLELLNGLPATVSTNGHFLTVENAEKLALSGLKKLIISLDGLDQGTYSTYRINGNAAKVIEGIRNLSEVIKKSSSSLKVEIQVLVNRYNERQIPEIANFGMDMGFPVVLKSMQVYDSSSINEWMPSDKRFRRYALKSNDYEIRSRLPRRCARLWFNPVVTWDGKVVPCCFDKDAGYVMGTLKVQSFRDIWHGENFRNFRKMVLRGREKIPMCRNCTSGLSGVR